VLRTAKVKVGGRVYVVAVIVPAALGRAWSGLAVLLLPRPARRAPIRVGHSSKVLFLVTVSSAVGTVKKRLRLELSTGRST
jgi:hypothetical protein